MCMKGVQYWWRARCQLLQRILWEAGARCDEYACRIRGTAMHLLGAKMRRGHVHIASPCILLPPQQTGTLRT